MPSSPRPNSTPESFATRLLAWWDRDGRKDLPWQLNRNAYRVWVSEIMLQQTQVAAVIPYFERWMARFPNLETLAHAKADEVLSLWSGLGYYARARNLHKAAKTCLEEFGSRLPDDAEALQQLPGIGPSTANAIVSLAFNRPAAILDGNVKRVVARHAGVAGWPGKSAVLRELWGEAEKRLPKDRAADYSQAIMDLGATLCRKQNPDCRHCPVHADCTARSEGTVAEIPAKKPAREVPERTVHMLLLRDNKGRVLLQRRPPSGIWGGLWSLPEGETEGAACLSVGLERMDGARSLPELEHRLTHLHLRIQPVLVTCPPSAGLECTQLRESPDLAWFGKADWKTVGLPRPVSKILQQMEQQQ